MTHVATFHDWADARMWETIGTRHAYPGAPERKKRDVFGSHNPYSTIALRDGFGVHSKVKPPAPPKEGNIIVEAVHWTDSKSLPEDILESNNKRQRLGLIAELAEMPPEPIRRHLERAKNTVTLKGLGVASVTGTISPRNIWGRSSRMFLHVELSEASWNELVKGTTYRVTAEVREGKPSWILDTTIVR